MAVLLCVCGFSIDAQPMGTTVVYTCTFSKPQPQSVNDYTLFDVAGCELLNVAGQPCLPFRTTRILIPSGHVVQSVTATVPGDTEEIPGNWRIHFGGQGFHKPGTKDFAFKTELDRKIYASDEVYPRSRVELLSVQRLAGYDIAILRVFPLQYRPASGRVFLAEQIKVELALARSNKTVVVQPPRSNRAVERVKALVDNPEAVLEHASVAASEQLCDYLLITSEPLASAFEPLLKRKTLDGLKVKLVTMDFITNHFCGRDTPEKIRNCIREAYTNSGISYVLLGGGATVIPCRYAFVRVGLAATESYVPSDLYYACLDGSWNANGDNHWGEPTDGEDGEDVDLLAEVFVGRAPVSTLEQAMAFVSKTIRYETDGNTNASSALLMSTYLGEFPSGPCQGASMYESMNPLFANWTVRSLRDGSRKGPGWSKQDVIAGMSQSPHLVLYNGHGEADVSMRMRSSDVRHLTNQWPFLICSLGCDAGQFDHGNHWPDSVGEAIVNSNAGGAFAAVLNSRAGWFDPQFPTKYSAAFQERFIERLAWRIGLGAVNQLSKESLLGQVEKQGLMTYRWCYYEITLFGDPHLVFKWPESKG